MVGIFVGYDPHTQGYRVTVGNKVVVSRNVHFVEGKGEAIVVGRANKKGHSTPAVEAVAPA